MYISRLQEMVPLNSIDLLDQANLQALFLLHEKCVFLVTIKAQVHVHISFLSNSINEDNKLTPFNIVVVFFCVDTAEFMRNAFDIFTNRHFQKILVSQLPKIFETPL